MLPRFFAPGLDPAGGDIELPEDEARHLSRVLRLGPGAAVEVFDGRGREFVAEVSGVARDRVRVRLVTARAPLPAPVVPVVVAQAILKGAHMDDVVRDVTMMGAAAIVPLVSAHVTVPGKAIDGGRMVERWGRIALASVKQCRRSTLPEIGSPTSFQSWITGRATAPGGMVLMLVEPSALSGDRDGGPAVALRALMREPAPASATLLVGPEGGWSPEEIRLAVQSGVRAVTLGPLTLRADAVALAALAALAVVWGE